MTAPNPLRWLMNDYRSALVRVRVAVSEMPIIPEHVFLERYFG
jgi:hypothetical protein